MATATLIAGATAHASIASAAERNSAADAAPRESLAARPLRILLLGGTRFIGVHMTELALARGHEVTHFNRGRSSEAMPGVERLLGDRDGQLQSLEGRDFDAVIDNSGYVPRHVRLSAELLSRRVPQYVFISSISVYPDFSVPRDETSPVDTLADETIEKVDGDTYGPLKALCEQAAERALPGKVTIIRPGLIVGPHDNTDRFTYWPARAARGGDMLCPGTPRDGIQIIDARDLAAFTLDAIERRRFGVYNLVSPPGLFTMGALIDASLAAASGSAREANSVAAPAKAVWASADFLATQKIEPWADMPVWFPAVGDEAAFAATSASRALAAGLSIRPLTQTVEDTLRWHLSRPASERETLKAGLSAERERAALSALAAAA